MDSLLARLSRGERLVGDGAWGTQLMLRGLPAGQPPEWFALERPEVIEEVARLYVEAGADLVTTDTFGGSSFRLRLHGLDGERARINRQAVEAVKRAVAGRALASASIGPSGQLLEPFGDTSASRACPSPPEPHLNFSLELCFQGRTIEGCTFIPLSYPLQLSRGTSEAIRYGDRNS